ncbi:MAG TPA: CbiX/SirB N-terminal domain-containing protein [Streptosporangiaceae bacterium]|nr:CbiX/SirB N-terminal domain-containing protein [Streptosporangiaceae bacterium]
MSGPTLLAVAHGSSHPAATATITALARQVGRLAPVLDIQVAFVQHAEPTVADALDAAGTDVVVVPLLLSTGYHLTTDIRGAVTVNDTANDTASTPGVTGPRPAVLSVAGPRAGASPRAWPRVAGPLGPDQLLVTALTSRLAEAGAPPGTPVVLAAAGSSDPLAAAQVAAQAALLADDLGVPVVPAFAAAGRPTVPEAVAGLRASTEGPVAVATYLLAPGQFHDRLAESGAEWVTEPLGDHPAVAALIIDRYRTHRAPARAA